MIKKKTKAWFAVALACCMVLGAIPMTAMAAEQTLSGLVLNADKNNVVIPAEHEKATIQLSAKGQDQSQADMPAGPLDWKVSVCDKDGNVTQAAPPSSVSLSTGTTDGTSPSNTLTVLPSAASGFVKVTASSKDAPAVTGSIIIELAGARKPADAEVLFGPAGGAQAVVVGPVTIAIPASGSATYEIKVSKWLDQYGDSIAPESALLANMNTAVDFTSAQDPAVTFQTKNGVMTIKVGSAAKSTTTFDWAVGDGAQFVKKISFSLADVVPNWDAEVTAGSITYGQAIAQAFALPAAGAGTANTGNSTLYGTYSVENGTTLADAGSMDCKVIFTVTSVGPYQGKTYTRTYPIIVHKKPVTVTVNDTTVRFGEDAPAFTFSVPDGSLVGQDTNADLSIVLTSNYEKGVSDTTSNLPITGSSNSENYDVTVVPGTLTVQKAAGTLATTVDPSLTADGLNAYQLSIANVTSSEQLINFFLSNGKLPAMAAVNYGSAGQSIAVPVTWTISESYDVKGGKYTLIGEVADDDRVTTQGMSFTTSVSIQPVVFNAEIPTAPYSVTPDTNQTHAAFGLPMTIQATVESLDGSKLAKTGDFPLTWSPDAGSLALTPGQSAQFTISNIPAWATSAKNSSATVTVSSKSKVAITIPQIPDTTYGQTLTVQDPTVSALPEDQGGDGTVPQAPVLSWRYTGTTANGEPYDAADAPKEAGTYTVTATLVSDTHYGSASKDFTIFPKEISITVKNAVGVYGTVTDQFSIAELADGVLAYDDTVEDLALQFSTTIMPTTGVGNYTDAVDVSVGNRNYSAVVTKGEYTVNPMDITGSTIEGTPGVGADGGVTVQLTVGGISDAAIEWSYGYDVNAMSTLAGHSYSMQPIDSNQEMYFTAAAKQNTNYTGTATAKIRLPKLVIGGMLGATMADGSPITQVAAGMTYLADTSAVTPAQATEFTYQWKLNGTDIPGATQKTYTVGVQDEGVLSVTVTAAGDFTGSLTHELGTIGTPTIQGTVTVTGETTMGKTLTASVSFQQPAPVHYTWQWMRGDKAIEGATGTEYVLTRDDLGKEIFAVVLADGVSMTGSIQSHAVAIPAVVPELFDVKLESQSTSDLKLSWNVYANGSDITKINVVLKDARDKVVKDIDITLDVTSYLFSDLSSDTTYTAYVTAENAVGMSQEAKVSAKTDSSYIPPIIIVDDDNDKQGNIQRFSTASTFLSIPATTLLHTKNIEVTFKKDGESVVLVLNEDLLDAIGREKRLNVTVEAIDLADYKMDSDLLVKGYRITLFANSDEITDFKGESIQVTLPYTLTNKDKSYQLTAYQFTKYGKIWEIDGAVYHRDAGGVRFYLPEPGLVAVGFDPEAELIDVEFTDVKKDRWSYEYIMYLAQRGIINGIGNHLFAPDKAITRAEFVKMLSSIAPYFSADYAVGSFADVTQDDWYAQYIEWARDAGITNGTSDQTFSPNDLITREEMAAMIDRAIESFGYELTATQKKNAFLDEDDFSDYAYDSIYAMQRAGILNGMGGNLFVPQGNATREQAAKIIALLYQMLIN